MTLIYISIVTTVASELYGVALCAFIQYGDAGWSDAEEQRRETEQICLGTNTHQPVMEEEELNLPQQ
ncbi:hypothetical protein J6590_071533 [Homalodisca vitripennis]|nr:hypothetical protein J6590_071533 [Homalodisca vitripennis]